MANTPRRTRTLLRLNVVGVVGAALAMSACSSAPAGDASSSAPTTSAATSAGPASSGPEPSAPSSSSPSGGMTDMSGMPGMEHDMDGGPVPAGMTPAAHPAYPVGSTVTLMADHMHGMQGAKAVVRGAYDTTTYAVDYTPTTGGAPVRNHKWVVQQEIQGAGSTPLRLGAHVVLTSDHMEGMKGARATIVQVVKEPVYVVDYDAHGMTMRNHKWVVQSEMKPAS